MQSVNARHPCNVPMRVNPQSCISKKGGGDGRVMKTRIARTCSTMLGEATDMDKQDKELFKDIFLDILTKHLHANLKIV